MREEERARIARLLKKDKEEINAETRAAALAQFLRVAAEFFDPIQSPELRAERTKDGFSVAFVFRASRVKNFTSVTSFGKPR